MGFLSGLERGLELGPELGPVLQHGRPLLVPFASCPAWESLQASLDAVNKKRKKN